MGESARSEIVVPVPVVLDFSGVGTSAAPEVREPHAEIDTVSRPTLEMRHARHLAESRIADMHHVHESPYGRQVERQSVRTDRLDTTIRSRTVERATVNAMHYLLLD